MGHEAALQLCQQGVTVYALARRTMSDLKAAGVKTISVDLVDDDAVTEAIQGIIAEAGRVDILINNAGYGSYGSIEDLPISEAKHQYQVNVFSAMRITQLVLPVMRRQGRGRIVNITSMGGLFTMALGGWYHSTKYALESLSDALRQEVRQFGINVVIVEPGLINTGWPATAYSSVNASSGEGAYADMADNLAAGMKTVGSRATDPKVLGRVIAHAALTPRPKTRYRRGLGSCLMPLTFRLMPTRLSDLMILAVLNKAGDMVEWLAQHVKNDQDSETSRVSTG
jgi:short-subunit dehydrogenase